MMLGIVALCQPWVEVLHRYSILMIIVGLVAFNVFSRITPPPAAGPARATDMADIQIIDAEKHFGANHVIRKLNLQIRHGEFVVLLGPSGCGKTTTLRALAGLESIDSGEIRIGGRRVDQLPPQERDTAFVFQLYSLYPHLTAFDNIAFPLRAAGMPEAKVREQVVDGGQGAAHRSPAEEAAVGAGRWRHAARHDRPRAGAPAVGDADGRADRRTRRQAARGDARRTAPPARRERFDHGLRHARPGRSDVDGRQDRRHERRRAAAVRQPRPRCTTSRPTCSSRSSSAARS